MKYLSLLIIPAIVVAAHAVQFPTLTVLTTLVSLNRPVLGFFGFFRRRSSLPIITEEQESLGPNGPVQFPASSYLPGGFFNPFLSSNRFTPGFQMPGFGGGIFQNRLKPVQSWGAQPPNPQPPRFPSMNIPQQPRPAQFNPQGLNLNTAFEEEQGNEVSSEDPTINTEEAESFFTLLAETDENKCISRLVCEMGADPLTAGELGTSISDIIGSLTDFPAGSKVFEYNQVLHKGRTEGMSSCQSSYSSCDEESYALMKDSQLEARETVEA